jgi:DNA-binding HxlR family transcriptional regulator
MARTYGQACATAHALDLIGERWGLLVVRELLLGPKRFTDLLAAMPGASPNVVSHRLRELEEHGVVRRRRLGPPSGSRVYELTEWGAELEPVLAHLGRWGARSPSRPVDAFLSTDSFILGLRSMWDARAAAELRASYELRLGDDRFRAEVADGRLELVRGSAVRPDATIEADVRTLEALTFGDRPLAEAIRAGDVKVAGDRDAVERLLGLFPLPEQAVPPPEA